MTHTANHYVMPDLTRYLSALAGKTNTFLMLDLTRYLNALEIIHLIATFLWIQRIMPKPQFMELGGCTYIMTNTFNNVYYIGVTSDLYTRVNQHKTRYYPDSFTSKYNCHKLVWYESFFNIEEAIAREKQLKNWKRQWKIELIEKSNPGWKDLFNEEL